MLKKFTKTSTLACVLFLATPLSITLGLLLGKFLLPFVQAVTIFPAFCGFLMYSNWRRTVVVMLTWALVTAVVVALLTQTIGDSLGSRVLLGKAYRSEMYAWIRTGIGAEGDITQFLPEHLFHFLVFSLLATVSAGFLGLVMGAVLLNYMSFYVGSLIAQSPDPLGAALLGWPPWAVIRVVAYVTLATPLSGLTLSRLGLRSANPQRVLAYVTLGIGLLALDILLKWWLATTWQHWLTRLVLP